MYPAQDLHSVALGLVVKVTAEQREEVVHLGLEQLENTGQYYPSPVGDSEGYLFLVGVRYGLGEVGEVVSHLGGSDVGRGVLESLPIVC